MLERGGGCHRFDLQYKMRVFADYHTHTKYSHGKGTVLDNTARAHVLGLEEIAISDHGPAHMLGIGIEGLHILDKIRADANHSMQVYPNVKVKLAVEANVTSIDGSIDITQEYCRKLDMLQVGLHFMVHPRQWLDGLNRTTLHLLRGLTRNLRQKSRLLNTEALTNAVYRHNIDVITHPGYRFEIDSRALAKACAARNTAFEINTSHEHMTVELISLVADEGVDFVIGSDAHHPHRVGDVAKGLALAQTAGLSAKQIRNACD